MLVYEKIFCNGFDRMFLKRSSHEQPLQNCLRFHKNRVFFPRLHKSSFFHNSRLIRRIQKKMKFTKKLTKDQELNPDP